MGEAAIDVKAGTMEETRGVIVNNWSGRLLLHLCIAAGVGGAMFGFAYIAFVVIPPISEWQASHPGTDWQSPILWYFYLVAGVSGAFFGVLVGCIAWISGEISRKWSASLVIEIVGVGVGTSLGVIALYLFAQSHDVNLRQPMYPLGVSVVAVSVMCLLTYFFRKRSHKIRG